MPTPTVITDLSTTAANNYPAGSDSPAVLDDVQRAHAAFIAQLRDGKGFSNPVTLASGTATDIGGQSSLSVEISGTTTITSFGTTYNGPRFLRFTGALILTHASALNLPGAANITTVAGDTALAIPNLALTGWNVVAYQRNTVPGTAPNQTLGDSSTLIANTAFVAAALAALQLVPSGSVIHVAQSTAPAGYLKANGAAVSRSTYAGLFTAIGTVYGTGDGSTTFNVPDLRGEFVRGWDDARGVDSARAIGSAQGQDLQPHTHTVTVSALAQALQPGGGSYGQAQAAGSTTSSSTGTTETRPRNVALLACIKT